MHNYTGDTKDEYESPASPAPPGVLLCVTLSYTSVIAGVPTHQRALTLQHACNLRRREDEFQILLDT